MIKVLIFDMDGTIIDSDDIIINSWKELISLYKPKDFKVDVDRLRTYSGPPVDYSIKDLFPEMDRDFILNEYRTRTKKYYKDLKLFDDCKEVLTKFYNDGYKLAIVTSKNFEMTKKSLERFEIFNLFEFIVTCDSVKSTKPDPEGMNLVLSHFNIKPEEAISVGDSDYDYYAAKNANIPSILMSMCIRLHENDVNPLKYCKSYLELYEEIKDYDK